MDGLLLVDKPAGITSFDVIRRLRRQTGVRKIGHAGTLDPLATGLMLVLFGTACKHAMQLSKLDKTYLAEVKLGETSSTDDGEGAKEFVSALDPSYEAVALGLARFKGEISQIPSIYSAIKIDGQEAYKRARAGEQVTMPARNVTIHSIRLVTYEYPYVRFEVHVSSGTYIRSLARDLGEALTTGAYLSNLRRTSVANYRLDEALALDVVDASNLADHLMVMS